MSSDDQTVGQQQPPERPAPAAEPETRDDEIDAEREQAADGLSAITTEPGRRRTDNVEMLVIEAELVADGHEPDNPATPRTESVGEAFRERIEDTDLVPAWTRPWEGADE